VNEDILSAFLLNEPIALLVVKPFYTTYCHGLRPPIFLFDRRLSGTCVREDASPDKHQPFSHRLPAHGSANQQATDICSLTMNFEGVNGERIGARFLREGDRQ